LLDLHSQHVEGEDDLGGDGRRVRERGEQQRRDQERGSMARLHGVVLQSFLHTRPVTVARHSSSTSSQTASPFAKVTVTGCRNGPSMARPFTRSRNRNTSGVCGNETSTRERNRSALLQRVLPLRLVAHSVGSHVMVTSSGPGAGR